MSTRLCNTKRFELAEAMSNTIQHILTTQQGIVP